jgi:hypothetical protein
MKKIMIITIACLLSAVCHAQDKELETMLQTIQQLKDRPKKNEPDKIKYNLQIVQLCEKVIQQMSRTHSEDLETFYSILFTAADSYIRLGMNEPYYIDNRRQFKKYLPEWLPDRSRGVFWYEAKRYLNTIIDKTENQEDIDEASELLSFIDEHTEEYWDAVDRQLSLTRKKEEVQAYIKKLKIAKRDYSPFFTIGTGTGISYGDFGVKASFYTAPNGVSFVGSMGTWRTKWAAGMGVGFANTYKGNLHLQMLYGNRWYSQTGTYIKAGNIGVNINIDVYKNIGINLEGGVWIATNDGRDLTDWDWAIGIYYKL